MDDALAHWLALREAADAVARSAGLTRAVAAHIERASPANVLDLATGTGSNFRFLAGRLPRTQRWLAVDRSASLLDQLSIRTSAWGAEHGYKVTTDGTACVLSGERLDCRIETMRRNLDSLDDADIFADRHLVTASALLDLVSEPWLRSLASRCRAAGAAALFTITYNGITSCLPAEPEDAMVLNLFNRHQRTDKGLGGPAAGPDAAACAVRCFAEAGYDVRNEPSDWHLGPSDVELQRQLIAGWAEAATEMAVDAAAIIAGWRNRRLQHVEAGRSRLVVGHTDVAGWPGHQHLRAVSGRL
jgi:hypothetical protein